MKTTLHAAAAFLLIAAGSASAQVHYRAAKFGIAPPPQRPSADLRIIGPGPLDQSQPLPITGISLGDIISLGGPIGEAPETLAPAEREAEAAGVNWPVVDALIGAGPHRVTLPLPSGGSLEIVLLIGEIRDPQDVTWIGQIAGVAASDVILTRYRDALRMVVRNYNTDGETLEVRYTNIGLHALINMDRNASDACAGGLPPRLPGPANANPAELAGPDDRAGGGGYGERSGSDPGNRVDVMIVATDNARGAYGSANAFVADAQAMIADANTRIAGSGGVFSYRLCAAPWDLIPGTPDTDLTDMLNGLTYTGGSNSEMDAVQNNRNNYRPDLVALICESVAGGFVGQGWAPANSSQLNVAMGYTVTVRSAAIGNGSFAHELGHNMSACHNAQQADCSNTLHTAPRGIARFCDGGFFYDDSEWRTTMSYRVNTSVNSTRIARFSVNGLYHRVVGTFGEEICNLQMWDGGAQSINTIHVALPAVRNYNLASTQLWAQPGATANQGLFQWPYGLVRDAVANVKGGTAQGVVRVRAGSFPETGGSARVLRNPCIVRAFDGPAVIR